MVKKTLWIVATEYCNMKSLNAFLITTQESFDMLRNLARFFGLALFMRIRILRTVLKTVGFNDLFYRLCDFTIGRPQFCVVKI